MNHLLVALALTSLSGCYSWIGGNDDETAVGRPPVSPDTAAPTEPGEPPDTGEDGVVLKEGFASGLVNTGGCSDTFMYAANVDDTVALAFVASGLAEQAHAAGTSTENSFDLSQSEVSLVVYTGENVSHTFCNDALWLEVIVQHEYHPLSGSAALSLEPDLDEEILYEGFWPADATLILSDVLLSTGEQLPEVHLDTLEIQAFVGWLPG